MRLRFGPLSPCLLLAAVAGAPVRDASAKPPAWAAALSPEAAIDSRPDAAWIQARMRETYARLSSYQDSGTLRTVYTEAGRPSITSNQAFATAFTRQGGILRFEIDSPGARAAGDRDIVWRNGTQMRSWDGLRQEDKVLTGLDEAVDAAVRLAGLPWSFHVFTLLLPGTGRAQTPVRPVLTRIADGTHESKPCFRLQLLDKRLGEAKRIFWIHRTTYHLLRVDEFATIDLADGPHVTVDKQIVFSPRYNKRVPAKALAYR